MTAERWKQIKTVYQRASETAPEKRDALISEICGDDFDLRCEIKSMLQFQNACEDFIEVPVFDLAAKRLPQEEVLPVGEQIENYRIVREIGRGGMGVVYLAERFDGLFDRRVALKIIKRGMDSDAILKRFMMERQILAALDHPNIARLLDGGTTERGLPYFVLEYVEGLPVHRFCNEKNLNLDEKLKLFRKICEAVAYAHQNLVVHRDLKPSNILVNQKGEPKLLDFGIARLLHAEASGETALTETGKRMLTPEYASPEQLNGERITTQSDVYSLGVLLSKLVGSPAPGVGNSKSITENLTDDRQSTQIRRQGTNGDLKAILQTALREDIEKRYSSVEQLSDDIRRYLEGLPVSARKDSFAYKAAKFVYRNQSAVFASAFVVLALLAATAFSIRQMRRANAAQIRAEQRFNDVRKLANAVVFDYHDKIENLSGSTEVRGLMLKDSLRYLDSLAQESSGDAGLSGEIGAAYLKIGDAQGKPFAANAGDTGGALESYRKAEQVFLKLMQTDAENREFQVNLSRAWEGIGKIQTRQLEVDEAIELHRKSFVAREKLLNENPSDNSLRELLAETLINLGDAIGVKAGQLSDQSDFQTVENLILESLEIFRRALALRQTVAAENQSAENLRRLAIVWQRIGFRLVNTGERRNDETFLHEGLTTHLTALQTFDKARNIEPESAKIRRNYYDQLMITAEIRVLLKDFEAARQNYLQVQKSFEKISADDPTNAEAKRDLVNLFDRWGRFYVAQRNAPKAIENYRKAAQILGEVYKSSPTKSDEIQLNGLHWWSENAGSYIARQSSNHKE